MTWDCDGPGQRKPADGCQPSQDWILRVHPPGSHSCMKTRRSSLAVGQANAACSPAIPPSGAQRPLISFSNWGWGETSSDLRIYNGVPPSPKRQKGSMSSHCCISGRPPAPPTLSSAEKPGQPQIILSSSWGDSSPAGQNIMLDGSLCPRPQLSPLPTIYRSPAREHAVPLPDCPVPGHRCLRVSGHRVHALFTQRPLARAFGDDHEKHPEEGSRQWNDGAVRRQ